MKHTFSFSLFGDDTRYTHGIERNAEYLQKCGIDYEVILHTDKPRKVPDRWVTVLHVPKDPLDCHFWRFTTVGTRPMVHVRDIDSTISDRELPELTRSPIYCMRDHHYHSPAGGAPYPVQGGMWGCSSNMSPRNFSYLVKWWMENKRPFQRYSDMWFLNRYIYPYIRRFGIEIDGCGSSWGGVPFSTNRQNDYYVGKVD